MQEVCRDECTKRAAEAAERSCFRGYGPVFPVSLTEQTGSGSVFPPGGRDCHRRERGWAHRVPAGPWQQEEGLHKNRKSLPPIEKHQGQGCGAADGTRTRTPMGHKHLKLASLPIPAQPQLVLPGQLYHYSHRYRVCQELFWRDIPLFGFCGNCPGRGPCQGPERADFIEGGRF